MRKILGQISRWGIFGKTIFRIFKIFHQHRKFLGTLCRWGIFGLTFVFLASVLRENWQDVQQLHLQPRSWLFIGMALVFAIANQLWTGVIWGWILASLKQPVPRRWAMLVFLKNAPARYLPGSIWHLYGRVRAAQLKGVKLELATLSVAMEPLCVIAAALGLALLGDSYPELKSMALIVILVAIHPRVINFLWQLWNQICGKQAEDVCMPHYPVRIVFGSIIFMTLRGLTFLMALRVFSPITWSELRETVGWFGFAWLLSLVVPSPAGLGVLESFSVQILHDLINPSLILGVIAIYRVVMLAAELCAAGIAHLISETPNPQPQMSRG
jgi:glycosyltransferase 2 family protein